MTRDDCNAQRDMLAGLLVCLQHVKDLTLGSFCIQVLAALEVKGLPSPLSECKRLTLIMHMKKWDLPGIASVLQSSPDLETLVMDLASPCYPEVL
ncbi:putative F-box protein At1g49610 isoform X2 [Cornus florida]|uniref:putative F-box protein At1g49610 isoform X2 n=1 Tax=Cornus florida TaxID=4283 RepID=UPI0028A20836|nr:putative F-box protein At1g49610 isoform X2 [Cornus florida]